MPPSCHTLPHLPFTFLIYGAPTILRFYPSRFAFCLALPLAFHDFDAIILTN